MSGGVLAPAGRGELAASGWALLPARLLVGAATDRQRVRRRGSDASGVPRARTARAEAAQKNRARGMALPNHRAGLPKTQAPADAQIALVSPTAAPSIFARHCTVASRRSRDRSCAGEIVHQAPERSAALLVPEIRLWFGGENSP